MQNSGQYLPSSALNLEQSILKRLAMLATTTNCASSVSVVVVYSRGKGLVESG